MSNFAGHNNEPASVNSGIVNEDQARAALALHWRELRRICGRDDYLEDHRYLTAVRRVAASEDIRQVLQQLTGSCGL